MPLAASLRSEDHTMADEKDSRNRSDEVSGQGPATFSGESRGSSANTATELGRGGDVLVQDDIVYGRPLSGRDRAEADRAPDPQAADAERTGEMPDHEKEPDHSA